MKKVPMEQPLRIFMGKWIAWIQFKVRQLYLKFINISLSSSSVCISLEVYTDSMVMAHQWFDQRYILTEQPTIFKDASEVLQILQHFEC